MVRRRLNTLAETLSASYWFKKECKHYREIEKRQFVLEVLLLEEKKGDAFTQIKKSKKKQFFLSMR